MAKALIDSGRYDTKVRANRAYLAGFGTSGSLLAGAALLFVVASAIVAFRGWPQVGDPPPAAAVSVASAGAGSSVGSRADRVLTAAVAAHAPATAGSARGAAGTRHRASVLAVSRRHGGPGTTPGSPGSPTTGSAGTGSTGSTGATGSAGSGTGCVTGCSPIPSAPNPSSVVSTAGTTISNTGSQIGSTASGVADTVASSLSGVSQPAAGAVQGAGSAVGGAVSGTSTTVGGVVSGVGGTVTTPLPGNPLP